MTVEVRDAWDQFLATRSERCREFLIEQNMGLVERVLRGFRNVRACDREDLRGAGYVGLIRAVDEWRPVLMAWERFACHKIRFAMVDHVRELSWVPKGVRARAAKVEALEEQLHAKLGRRPTDAELGEKLGITEEETRALLTSFRSTDWTVISLDWRAESEAPWAESVIDHSAEDPAVTAARREEIDQLELILQRLSGRERRVLKWRFLQWPRISQKEIAGLLGVHESRVSQIVDAAVERARKLKEQPRVLFPEVYAEGPRMTVRE